MAKKKVKFRKMGTRTSTVKVQGYEDFTVTFKVPSRTALINLYSRIRVGGEFDEADGAVYNPNMGTIQGEFVADHLEKWSLEPTCNRDNLDALDDSDVLAAIFDVIQEAGEEAKN